MSVFLVSTNNSIGSRGNENTYEGGGGGGEGW